MNSWSLAAALVLSVIAIAHSVLGERRLLRPLLAVGYPKPGPIPRTFAHRTLRAAWHIMSILLLGMAVVVLGPVTSSTLTGLAVTMGVVAMTLAFATRGAHFAWPVFLTAAGLLFLAGHGEAAAAFLRTPVAVILSSILGGLAGLHVYWAFGGQRGFASAIPIDPDGKPVFSPSAGLTLMVALGLIGLSFMALVLAELVALPLASTWARGLLGLAAGVFLLRAVGDFRYCGFFKRPARSTFARRDTAVYTPLCVGLGILSLILVA